MKYFIMEYNPYNNCHTVVVESTNLDSTKLMLIEFQLNNPEKFYEIVEDE